MPDIKKIYTRIDNDGNKNIAIFTLLMICSNRGAVPQCIYVYCDAAF